MWDVAILQKKRWGVAEWTACGELVKKAMTAEMNTEKQFQQLFRLSLHIG